MFMYFEQSHEVNLEKFQKFCRQSQDELKALSLNEKLAKYKIKYGVSKQVNKKRQSKSSPRKIIPIKDYTEVAKESQAWADNLRGNPEKIRKMNFSLNKV